MNPQNLQQENGTLLMTKPMTNMTKVQPLNLRQRLLNQTFVITQMHIFL